MTLLSLLVIIASALLLLYISTRLWLHFIQHRFISGMEWALLEIRIPREVKKTPLAMELILSNALYQVSNKKWSDRWIKGAVRFWYSLEIVSIDGNVHFFIWTPTRTKDLVEAQIYAQFPQAQVLEVEDYTYRVPYELNDQAAWGMWGCEFTKSKSEVIPIKTYPAYKLDKTGEEEEEKVDPLTATLEFMGSCKPGEQVWVQILIRGSGPMHKRWGDRFKKHDWITEAQKVIDKLNEPYKRQREPDSVDMRIPDEVRNVIEAVDRGREKLGFDCGIRCVYIAENDSFSKNTHRAMRMIFRQYSSYNLNSLELSKPTFPDWGMKNGMLDQYRKREYFYPDLLRSVSYPWPISNFFPPLKPKPFIMTTEELATIFHFPGRVAETPSLRRIESKTAEPPSNLPL